MSAKNCIKLCLLVFAAGLIGACSVGECPPDDSGRSPLDIELQLPYISVVPVLNGQPTTSYFYIHNDGESVLTGLTYSLDGATGNGTIDPNGLKLAESTLRNCATIPANGSCQIQFTTPSLTIANQNNSLFIATAKDANGFLHHFKQVINYAYYDPKINPGVNFAVSANVVTDITNKRYMMGYMVGGGESNLLYNNVNMLLSDSEVVNITQGFTNGESVVSGQLVPVEFAILQESNNNYPVYMVPQFVVSTVTSNALQRKAVTSAKSLMDIVIEQGQGFYATITHYTGAGTALKYGVSPLLRAPTPEAQAPLIYVSNFGESVPGFKVTTVDPNLVIYQDKCVNGIESNGSCSFRIGVNGNNTGSGNISFTLNGKLYVQEVYYKGSIPGPNLVSRTGMTNFQLDVNQSTTVFDVVFTNLGGEDLTNLVFTPKSSDPNSKTKIKVVDSSACANIPVNVQCKVKVQIIGGDVGGEAGSLYLEAAGNSGSTPVVHTTPPIQYKINPSDKLIFEGPIGSESTVAIVGDNLESSFTTFTVKNTSNGSLGIESIYLDGVDLTPDIGIFTNNCPNSLPPGGTCQIVVKYGPAYFESNIRGVANLRVKSPGQGNILTGTINYIGTGLDSDIIITNMATSGFADGIGSLESPFEASGCNVPNSMLMTITYRNRSVNFAAQNLSLNVINESIAAFWSVESTLTTCGYGANPKTLESQTNCNLVLVAKPSMMKTESSYNLNVKYPAASWYTPVGLIRKNTFEYNGSNSVYAAYTQPTIMSVINEPSSTNVNRTLTQTLVNAEGCGDFLTKISAIPNVTTTSASGNCVINDDQSVYCVNTQTNNQNTINYVIDSTIPKPVSLPVLFTLQTADKQVWYDPSILIFTLLNSNP